MYEDIQNNLSNAKKQPRFLIERLFVGSLILMFIGIMAYLILFVLMCAI